MAAPRFAISYVDGSSEIVARRPVHNMRAEKLCPKDAGANEVLLATLWAAATGGRGPRAEFEKWAETVDDWDRVDDEAAEGEDAPLDPELAGSPD